MTGWQIADTISALTLIAMFALAVRGWRRSVKKHRRFMHVRQQRADRVVEDVAWEHRYLTMIAHELRPERRRLRMVAGGRQL